MTTIRLDPIFPRKGLFDFAKFDREFAGALNHTSNIIRDDFKATVRSWRTNVKFAKVGPRRLGGNLAVDVFTENKIYFYVEAGTKAHIIRPRSARVLRFQTGYTAKTRPGVIGSRGGGPRGPFVTARSVRHPGTQPRNFSKVIAKRRQRNHVNLTRLAFNRSFRFGGTL